MSVHLIVVDSTDGILRFETANREDPCVREWLAWTSPTTIQRAPGRPQTRYAVWTLHPQTKQPMRPDPDAVDGSEMLAQIIFRRVSSARLLAGKLKALPDTSDMGTPRYVETPNHRIAFWDEYERAVAASANTD